ncbi:hypothetical protein P4O66_004137 [Electrophorus voltai]|uniref:Uncharacterized protein n=1 Tax=Electrophorus voltai TaxID=2609070 RepID=A0AAD9DKW3_9TELE|nr:hypothetical protein P4O66_004137 [Electrophorus voltai]
MKEMNGCIVGTKPLYVALAQRKEERQAHLTHQYMQGHGQRECRAKPPVLNPYQPPPALRLLHDGHSTGSELGYLLPEQATGTAPPQHPLGYAQHSATAFPIHAEYHQACCRPISGPGTSHCLRAGSGTSAGAEADVG